MPEAFAVGWKSILRAEYLTIKTANPITRAEMFTGGAWGKLAAFVPALSVSVSPNPAGGRAGSQSPIYVTSAPANAVVVGGTGPFAYAWSLVSGTVDILSPTTAATQFGGAVEPFSAVSATAKVTVTDAAGAVATATVDITLRNQPIV